jgi:hypothetical protein
MKQFGVTSTVQGDGKRRSVTAFCHIDDRVTRYGDDAMHIFDYIVFGVLIAITLGAGAMALHKAQ